MTPMLLPDFPRSLFLEGPAGSGKSAAAAAYVRALLADQHVPPQNILILLPHPALARPYLEAIAPLALPEAPHMVTLAGLARLAIRPFWNVIVRQLELNPDLGEPAFLTAELAQYYLGRSLQPYWEMGAFNSVRLPKYRVITQILDSINHAVMAGHPLDEVEQRLVTAWGERHSSRVSVYHTAIEIARQYQATCLQNGLLDYALQLHLLVNILLDNPDFAASFIGQFQYLIADNVEEMGALAHDFVFWCLENVPKTLIVYDHDGGYRAFLGADPANALLLRDVCLQRAVRNDLVSHSEPIKALAAAVAAAPALSDTPALPPDALHFSVSTFYPQMIESCVQQVQRLLTQNHAAPGQIAIVAPYLHDALLFALQTRLQTLGIASVYYRPSRPLIAEPVVQMLLTLLRLAAEPDTAPSLPAVKHALEMAIEGLDPIRAFLLAQAVYQREKLAAFDTVPAPAQERITPSVGLRYDQLYQWLADHASTARQSPPRFFRELAADILTQPGFGLNENVSSNSAVEGLISACDSFYQSLERAALEAAAHDFIRFVEEGFVTSDWAAERPDAVLIAPAHTVLTRDMVVDYQLWLDVGDGGWYERVEQPLTHPYVLRRSVPSNTVWTDEMEQNVQIANLRSLVLGLLRRCRKDVFLQACDISASGYEQRGQLLVFLQQALPDLAVAQSA